MSDWAETFPTYTPWQLKHQLAMWKSKVIGLEFENQVLRETLRDMFVNNPSNGNSSDEPDSSSSGYVGDTSEESMGCESDSDSESEAAAAGDSEDELQPEFKIGREHIEIFTQKFKIMKADAERRKREEAERERLAIMIEEQAFMNPQPNEDRTNKYKTLYGDDWQRVAALDDHLDSEYNLLCDREKPSYWPKTPLKINET